MEGPVRMPLQPGVYLGVLLGCLVLLCHMNLPARRYAALDPVEKADELLMAVTRHVLAHHGPVEHAPIQARAQR